VTVKIDQHPPEPQLMSVLIALPAGRASEDTDGTSPSVAPRLSQAHQIRYGITSNSPIAVETAMTVRCRLDRIAIALTGTL
jgi:hypothetical protein